EHLRGDVKPAIRPHALGTRAVADDLRHRQHEQRRTRQRAAASREPARQRVSGAAARRSRNGHEKDHHHQRERRRLHPIGHGARGDEPQTEQGHGRERDRDPRRNPRVPTPPRNEPLVPGERARRGASHRRRLPPPHLAGREAQSRPQLNTCVGVTSTVTEADGEIAASREYCAYFAYKRLRTRVNSGPRRTSLALPCTMTPLSCDQSSAYRSTVMAMRGLCCRLSTLRPSSPEAKYTRSPATTWHTGT